MAFRGVRSIRCKTVGTRPWSPLAPASASVAPHGRPSYTAPHRARAGFARRRRGGAVEMRHTG